MMHSSSQDENATGGRGSLSNRFSPSPSSSAAAAAGIRRSTSNQINNDQLNQQQRRKKSERRNGGGSALLDRSNNFLETAVRTAENVNKMLMDHCSLCTVYCDQQVQYESSSYATSNFIDDQYRLSEAANLNVGQLFQQMDIISGTGGAASGASGGLTPCGGLYGNNGVNAATVGSPTMTGEAPGLSSPSNRVEEVKQCQSNLFDEESVIYSVNSRQEGEEGHDDAMIPPKGY
mmetsp:Transcript_18476/g.44583  ORF Transcript_18476/g.44583 Transcript_18476/m.44583 type:complete len:233 (+) Transcript_18476:363-1061(+)|eukprot:CAMPEP_0113482750 /NCGR_PEP_ID=MMETSP0014_2-20120614/23082_1 /TAXON_ID=2857 /ORGANISM="Nitzschia sp." /LENGTH=232 /DNA_ID=CAMNT_0000376281 /DNA_START=1183 /DNA_END=1881 /DNA_ORIENTATION=+ /assembly_acc=CAM_ASM_000159